MCTALPAFNRPDGVLRTSLPGSSSTFNYRKVVAHPRDTLCALSSSSSRFLLSSGAPRSWCNPWIDCRNGCSTLETVRMHHARYEMRLAMPLIIHQGGNPLCRHSFVLKPPSTASECCTRCDRRKWSRQARELFDSHWLVAGGGGGHPTSCPRSEFGVAIAIGPPRRPCEEWKVDAPGWP